MTREGKRETERDRQTDNVRVRRYPKLNPEHERARESETERDRERQRQERQRDREKEKCNHGAAMGTTGVIMMRLTGRARGSGATLTTARY